MALSCSPSAAPEEILAKVPIAAPDDLLTRSGVTIDETVTADGNGSARIDAAGTTVVRIAELEIPIIDTARLVYRARLRARDLDGRTYLEMWCAFPGEGEFFSRALHAPLSGTVEWTTQETPFILQPGRAPSRVRLNLVIEGTGTVWIDDVELAAARR